MNLRCRATSSARVPHGSLHYGAHKGQHVVKHTFVSSITAHMMRVLRIAFRSVSRVSCKPRLSAPAHQNFQARHNQTVCQTQRPQPHWSAKQLTTQGHALGLAHSA